MKKILIIDDEARIREVLEYALQKEGFSIVTAKDGAEAWAIFEKEPPDLVVLDIMMPHMDGLEFCRRLRQKSSTPIVFLSARSEEIDRVLGLELGGDDYLTKPFSPRELLARVRAVLRRADPTPSTPPSADSPAAAAIIEYGGIRIDPARFDVRAGQTRVELTRTEFDLLQALFERPGIVLSRAQLMERAYRYDNLVTERTIDTHVKRVRSKFRKTGIDPIATVFGVGYKAFDV